MEGHTFGKFKEDISDMSVEELKTLQKAIKTEIFKHNGERVAGYGVPSLRVYKKMNAIIETKLKVLRT